MLGPARRAANRVIDAGRGLIGQLEQTARKLSARADSLEEANQRLRDETAALRDKVAALRGEAEALQGENGALRGENTALRDENKKLRVELAKKGRREKRQTAPFSRDKRKENPKKPGRKPGAEYGRQGNRRPPEHIDRVLDGKLPACCPSCTGRLIEGEVLDQYQTDIPPVVPIVTHFRVQTATCEDCHRKVHGRHPEQTSDAVGAAAQQIGPKALATASHMHSVLGLSYGKVAELLERCFGLVLLPSTLVRAQKRLGVRADPVYEELKLALRQAPFVYPDETGWRIDASSAWLWDFVSQWITIYAIERSRGQDVIEKILGLDYAGAVGHDGWAPYACLENAQHQTCLAHLLRRCDELLGVATRGAVHFPRAVKSLLLDALALRDRRDAALITPHGLLCVIGKLEARRDDLLDCSPTYEPNRLLRNHLDRNRDLLFTFLRVNGLEATNWPAEQGIRPAVVNRKVSGGNRSDDGAFALARLMTIFRTAHQQGRDGISFLVDLMRTPAGAALPSLLPAPYL